MMRSLLSFSGQSKRWSFTRSASRAQRLDEESCCTAALTARASAAVLRVGDKARKALTRFATPIRTTRTARRAVRVAAERRDREDKLTPNSCLLRCPQEFSQTRDATISAAH
jgi:hypothetical protein